MGNLAKKKAKKVAKKKAKIKPADRETVDATEPALEAFGSLDELLEETPLNVLEVPPQQTGWKRSVYVLEFDSSAFESVGGLADAENGRMILDTSAMAKIAALSLCTPDGVLLCPRDKWPEAATKLERKPFKALAAIAKASLHISGLSGEAIENATEK